MRPDSDKIKKLTKQHPVIAEILTIDFEARGNVDGSLTRVDDIDVRVERADGNLMFRQARNSGLGDSSFLFTTDGKQKDHLGRRFECMLAVNTKGTIIDVLRWPRNDEEQRGKPELYASAIGWYVRDLNRGLMSDPYWDMIESLVWVRVTTWHEDTRKDDGPESRFGELRSRELDVTIYTEPDGGFEKLEKDACFEKNLRLTTRTMTNGVIRGNTEIIRLGGMLDEMCRQFAEDVFFNGMKEVLDGGKVRGASGQFGSTKVLAGELCGYDRVMLEDPVCFVTFQRRPDSDWMYVLGMDGTLPQLRAMIRSMIRAWQNDPTARESFKPDRKISVV